MSKAEDSDKPNVGIAMAGRMLHQLKDGTVLWLDVSRYLDRCVLEKGVFEKDSSSWVRRLLHEGDVVLDVGANIGYYSIMMASLVEQGGRVLAFEPTKHYREVLERNLLENRFEQGVIVFPFGLSCREEKLEISIGECSATIHWVEEFGPRDVEWIEIKTLDEIWNGCGVDKLDFIKVDIDGHEPSFLLGAERTIVAHAPLMLLEVNHGNYLDAGWSAWDFYDYMKDKGWHVHSEKSGKEFSSRIAFLRECGNFDRSANILVATGERSKERLAEAARLAQQS